MNGKMDWAMRAAMQISPDCLVTARRYANIIRAWDKRRTPLPLAATDQVFAWDEEKNQLVPLADWRSKQA
jgi:hypothetical protein